MAAGSIPFEAEDMNMKNSMSRRSFAKLLGVASMGSLIRIIPNQDIEAPPTAAKLDERQISLYAGALRANRSAADSRLRHKLPENSEPCTVFIAERKLK